MIDANIDLYFHKGIQDLDWYQDCERCFVYLFGRERLHLVTQLFAATSINTSLAGNITLFRRALYEIENNLPVGKYVPVMKLQIERIRNNEPIQGRKISNFAKAMSGDPDAVVVDIWMLRAFQMDRQYYRSLSKKLQSGGATKRQYDDIEQYVKEGAQVLGVQPRQFCAALWSGCRIHHTGNFTTRYTDILTAKLTNLFNII